MPAPATTSERRRRLPRASACLGLLLAWLAATWGAGQAHPPPAGPALRQAIAFHLVRPEGAGFVRERWTREPDIVALYFGAGWCGPCHAFVPVLRRTRDALREAGADTEVVYVSLDATASDMRHYMRRQEMPWPAIDHRRLRHLPAIQALAGPAPPNLVLVDREGKVLAGGWEGHRFRGLQPVLDAWGRALTGPPQAPGGR
jgi:thiol-disulfide isomerase/thioredoxin